MTIEARLDAMAADIAELKGLALRILGSTDGGLTDIRSRLEAAADDRRKEWYSVAEFSESVGRSAFTVRDWCRFGRIRAQKREEGRGLSRDWEIGREELDRYRNHGLRPLRQQQLDGSATARRE